MKKLDILVPHWIEDPAVMRPLLGSIALQQDIDMKDIGVIVVNDGSDVIIPDDFFDGYPFDISYHIEPNKGVSATRNAAMDYSTADYVMFCDADDMFNDVRGIWLIFNEIRYDDFDVMISTFIEECRNPDNPRDIRFLQHKCDSTFVHGKVFRRQYLIDKNIRWNEELFTNEDGYFNALAQHCADKLKYLDVPFYMWRYRPDSICRGMPDFTMRTFTEKLNGSDALVQQFIDRGKLELAKRYAYVQMQEVYYMLGTEVWKNPDNQEYVQKILKRIQKYIVKYYDLCTDITKLHRTQMSSAIYKHITEKRPIDLTGFKPFNQWVDDLRALPITD